MGDTYRVVSVEADLVIGYYCDLAEARKEADAMHKLTGKTYRVDVHELGGDAWKEAQS